MPGKTKANLKPLIDHAIGALGDLTGELAMFRMKLHSIKKKNVWTEEELKNLRISLGHLANLCGKTVDTWEEETGVKIP